MVLYNAPMVASPPHELSQRRCKAAWPARLAIAWLASAALFEATAARGSANSERQLRIAVASNFRATAEAIAADFSRASGVRTTISSAASGVLAAQIQRGAPFDLFLAADLERPRALHLAGVGEAPPMCYARGRLVLLGALNIESALSDPTRSIAIANPRSAPYGRAAEEVLARDSFASGAQRRVLRGSNVQQALQFHASGASDLALVARSLTGDRGIPIPRTWHGAIDQYALVTGSGASADDAKRYLQLVRAEAARGKLAELGYEACP